MATTVRTTTATPEKVFEVLSDPDSYGYWVVGSRFIRDADPGFPAVGTKFHHQVGVGPIHINDHTEVLESERPRRLVLKAKARPAGMAKVSLDLLRTTDGTKIVMNEEPASLFSRIMHNPAADLLLHGRNVESLRRLAELAEARGSGGRAQPPG